MLSVENAVQLLSYLQSTPLAVSELTTKVALRHDKTIELVKELERRRLLARSVQKASRGRPRHVLRATLLGNEFIKEYNALVNLRLFSNKNDINKAIRSVELTDRLVGRGNDPYVKFLELNEFARNIASAAKASATA